MTLLDRHIEFVEALRAAGLPVSLAEGLDAVRAIDALDIDRRETLRAAYAATLVKRQNHRPGFDQVFDLYFPLLVGDGHDPSVVEEGDEGARLETTTEAAELGDGPQALSDFRDALAVALVMGDPDVLAMLAREGVQRFGLIRGRGPGEQRWSSYNVINRVSPDEVVEQALGGMLGDADWGSDPAMRRPVEAQARAFEQRVESEVRRRAAEVRGPQHVARHTIRPAIEQVDFSSARRNDLELMRREIQPLARRLATRLSREHHARSRGPLDFRRTVRASMSSGGVPMETRHKPKRPGRTDLVVLCDVSGSVANFASFTLMLVFALREQFNRVRAFTFVDEIHEVTDRFTPAPTPRPRWPSWRPAPGTRPSGAAPTTAARSRGSPTSTPTRSAPRPTCWCSGTPAPTTPTSPCPW